MFKIQLINKFSNLARKKIQSNKYLRERFNQFDRKKILKLLSPIIVFLGVLLSFYIVNKTFYINILIDMHVEKGSVGKVYWKQPNNNFAETRAKAFKITPGERKIYNINIPLSQLSSLRIDPTDEKSLVKIYEIKTPYLLSSFQGNVSNNFKGWKKNLGLQSYEIKTDHLFLQAENNDPSIVYHSIPINTSIKNRAWLLFGLILVLI